MKFSYWRGKLVGALGDILIDGFVCGVRSCTRGGDRGGVHEELRLLSGTPKAEGWTKPRV